jgi:predicted transcriptional regulator
MTTKTKQTRSADPLGHPMRRLIRQGLIDNGPQEISEIAEGMGELVTVVSYHFKVLKRAGLVEEIGQRRARGAIAVLYQAADGPCIDCHGNGDDPADGEACPTCNGSGKYEAPR